MFSSRILLVLFIIHFSYCDWVGEWMSPVQNQFQHGARKMGDDTNPMEEELEADAAADAAVADADAAAEAAGPPAPVPEFNAANLKAQLDTALQAAQQLAEVLKNQIAVVAAKEMNLKEAIANGRSGVTSVTVSTAAQAPRTYLVRDGYWTLCNGMVQYPPPESQSSSMALFAQLFSAPRCIGQEVQSPQDPCVFNSLIKYETVPQRRGLVYREEDYLCLKGSFRTSLEQYLSVPRHVINATCNHGRVQSIPEYTQRCGVRVMSEYAYYPQRAAAAAALPLEYCAEKDGSCKLIVAWHMNNNSIENFEFLKDEYNFKNYFLKPDHYNVDNAM